MKEKISAEERNPMKEKFTRDIFQEIADNRIQPGEAQREIPPAAKNGRCFEKCSRPFPYDEVSFRQEVPFQERQEAFKRELAALRERYRPFMADYLPVQEEGKEVVELTRFRFRYLEKGEIFTQMSREDALWEEVTLPDYRGPAGEEGRWKGYYRTFFACRKTEEWERAVLQFESVDYIAKVYVNGCFVGKHEGLFAPFSFDITDYIRLGEGNELVVECENDIPMMGVGDLLDGDKLYAATGPGWDDPETGWHHCPAGAGITGKVTLEYRPDLYLEDVFVCPDIDTDMAQIRVGVRNYTDELQRDYMLRLRILPKNFRGEPVAEYVHPVPYIGVGQNEYRFVIKIEGYRLWEPETPWLYGALLELVPAEGRAGKLSAEVESRAGKLPTEAESRTGKMPAEAESRTGKMPAEAESRTGKMPAEGRADEASADTESRLRETSERCISRLTETVGIRKFISDENSEPKGKFYLNNRPVTLRGANEMGHLQQCVMRGDRDTLVDDILIAKLCNLNYYRVTQRPVQREIYDYFDMLGMMHQCDLPLFSFLRRPQFAEGVRQCVEMEHLIRNHPSSVMVSLINEPMSIRRTEDPKSKGSVRSVTKGHRHLMRDELEAFFVAARQAIYTENPGRVVKNVEGDYEPPTMEGMPDFHCYTMWYSHHAIPIGKLLAGYLPALKTGWMAGCGEYGAEGLDNLHVMETRYPSQWLETDEEGHWYPDKIVRAQTHSLQGDWYQEQNNREDWVRESQIFQAKATALMTDAYRRRADIISHTAIHLLIDAWPAGWMKTLVDCERVPKRAYFAYRDSLVPVRMNFYCPRAYVYGGETVPVEVWLLNDSGQDRTLQVQAASGEEDFILEGPVKAASSAFLGTLNVTMPDLEQVKEITVEGCVRDITDALTEAAGKQDAETQEKVPGGETLRAAKVRKKVGEALREADSAIVSETAAFGGGRLYGEKLKLTVYPAQWRIDLKALEEGGTVTEAESDRVVLPLLTVRNREALERAAEDITREGRTAVLCWGEDKEVEFTFQGEPVRLKKCPEVFFAAAEEPYRKYSLNMLCNGQKGYIDVLAGQYVDTALPGSCQVYSYSKKGFTGSRGAKKKLPFVMEIPAGRGKLIAVSLETAGRIGVNANLDALLRGR